MTDVRDVLNWEASGHNTSNWSTYFYVRVSSSGLNADTLLSDVEQDINSGKPVVAEVMTQDLPNWPASGGGQVHYITITGYDNYNGGTYTYVDSCGKACGSNQDGGTNTISQSTGTQNLLKAITDYNAHPGANLTYNGGFDW